MAILDQTAGGRAALLRVPVRGRRVTVLTRGEAYAACTIALTAIIFLADRHVDLHGQWLLGVVPWTWLIGSLYFRTPSVRAATIGVVVVATLGECTFSLWWHFYIYRLHNLPLFIPAGHAILYLAALSFAESRLAQRFLLPYCGVAVAIGGVWAILGLTVLPQKDLMGVLGHLWWLTFLWWGRMPAVVASVFYGVTYIELFGVAAHVWRWQPHAWGVHVLTLGQPPVGATMFYIVFELGGFLIGPWIYFGCRGLLRRLRRQLDATRTRPVRERTAEG